MPYKLILLFSFILASVIATAQDLKVLHYTETSGYDHGTRNVSLDMFEDMGEIQGFTVDDDQTGDAFNSLENLEQYAVVVFSNTSGNSILNASQRGNFESYINGGGAYIGIHAASDTYRHSNANGASTGTWDWYAEMAGASVQQSPNHTSANYSGTMDHLMSSELLNEIPDPWDKVEEYYYWENGYYNDSNVGLLQVQSTGGQSYDAPRPMAWFKQLAGGGRSFYTALGHAQSNFTSDDDFRQLISNALEWAMEEAEVDCNGVLGGEALPDSPCMTAEEESGTWNTNCECIPNPIPCNITIMEVTDLNDPCLDSAPLVSFSISVSDVPEGEDLHIQYVYTEPLEGEVVENLTFPIPDGEDEISVSFELFSYGFVYDVVTTIGEDDSGCSSSITLSYPIVICEPDCNGVPDGGAFIDDCGNCVGGDTGEEACAGSILGTVDWNADCGSRLGVLSLYQPGTAISVEIMDLTVSPEGNFEVEDLPIGSFDAYIKVDGFLQKLQADVAVNANGSAVDFGNLTPGELTGDNAISVPDFSGFSAAYGTSEGDASFNFLADFNCDGNVNISDYSQFSSIYGSTGDSAE